MVESVEGMSVQCAESPLLDGHRNSIGGNSADSKHHGHGASCRSVLWNLDVDLIQAHKARGQAGKTHARSYTTNGDCGRGGGSRKLLSGGCGTAGGWIGHSAQAGAENGDELAAA